MIDSAGGTAVKVLNYVNELLRNSVVFQQFPYKGTVQTIKGLLVVQTIDTHSSRSSIP